ncbi:MAG: DNA polymerase III subunit delta, partial [Lachnospiraceae bacterium]|nr:DNA polymerase III subunit delta [Lachnospiraceae bacterium]
MSRFRDIVGQEQLREHLENAIRFNKISHAYIISGERNAGKEFIAKTFAMALQCENRSTDQGQEAEPCGECRSCRQALGANHPDIIRITHEKPNTIGVDDIRTQINNDVAIKPYSGSKKIYIINEGEKMTAQAQNALLKTLEEPPEYAVILILTANASALLPTILSRCVLLAMKPAKDDQIKKYLMENMEIPDYKADVCVAFARGNLGKARLLAKSEEFDKVKEEAITLLKYIGDMEVHEIVAAIKRINEYKFEVGDYLDILSIWYRDALL